MYFAACNLGWAGSSEFEDTLGLADSFVGAAGRSVLVDILAEGKRVVVDTAVDRSFEVSTLE